jgi:hypothetical protein
MKAIKHLHQTYLKQGFQIEVLLMDGQFNKDHLETEITKFHISFDCVCAGKYMPEIEQYICTIKERAQIDINVLPFKCYPSQMIVEIINYCVL